MSDMQTPRVVETKRLSAHTRQRDLVRALLLACPSPAYDAKPAPPTPYQSFAGRA